MQAPAQILRPDQKWLRIRLAGIDKANGRMRRQQREEVVVASGIKFKSAIELQHTVRILRLQNREPTGGEDSVVEGEPRLV